MVRGARRVTIVAASRESFLAHDVTRELHKRHRSVCCGKFRGIYGGSGDDGSGGGEVFCSLNNTGTPSSVDNEVIL